MPEDSDPPERADLPPELRAFLYSCIDSIEQLEILMLLRRGESGMTARRVTQELALVERTARVHLETLTARGLLVARPGNEVEFRLEPRTEALDRYVRLLAGHYTTARGAIHRFVATRCGRPKRFADAFRLWEREP